MWAGLEWDAVADSADGEDAGRHFDFLGGKKWGDGASCHNDGALCCGMERRFGLVEF